MHYIKICELESYQQFTKKQNKSSDRRNEEQNV